MRTTLRTAVSRSDRPGCSSGKARNCARRSGEALNSTQSAFPLVTTMDDWVRGRVRKVPLRTPSQFGQLQFHWGKPPPAAEPRTRIRTVIYRVGRKRRRNPGRGSFCVTDLAVRDIHRRIESEANLYVFRLSSHSHLQQFELNWDYQRGEITPISRERSM